MKKRTFPSVLFISLFMLTSCRFSGGETLVVGVPDGVADWSSYSAGSGIYYGIEIDLAEKPAERLGHAEVRFIPVETSAKPEKLLTGEVDCVMALLPVNDAYSEPVIFSRPYYSSSTALFCESSTLFTSLADVSGGVVGVTRESGLSEKQLLEAMNALIEDGTADSIIDEWGWSNEYVR